MDILLITHAINWLLMILIPIGLGIYLTRRLKLNWRLWWIGGATFILSQVGHIPFNRALTILFQQSVLPNPPENWQLAFNAIVLGLSAGLWEESARYATFRWWARDARSWRKGVLLGAGHGGIESILLGGLVLLTFVNMIIARQMDLSQALPPDQLALAQAQVSAYWAAPWYDTMLGALERAFTLPFHIAASLLVLQVFLRHQSRWLWLAIGWHALLNAGALYILGTWGPYQAEVWIGASAVINLAIIFALRGSKEQAQPIDEAPQPQEEPQALAHITKIDETPDKLEDTRYN